MALKSMSSLLSQHTWPTSGFWVFMWTLQNGCSSLAYIMVWDKVSVSVNILGVLPHHFILYPLLPLW